MVLLVACGTKGGVPGDAAAKPPVIAIDAQHEPIAIDAQPGTPGSVNVTVQWKDAGADVRASPGRDACGDARAPFAKVHTLFGVKDVVITVDGAPAAKPAPAAITLERCHFEPAVQLAGDTLRVASLVEPSADVEVAWSATLADPPTTTVARFTLPVAGASVVMPTKPTVLEVTSKAAADPAWVVIGAAALTDETGAATIQGVPPGSHTVTAWMHPGAGAPAKLVTGTVDVHSGAAADVTLSFGGAATADTAQPDVDPAP